MLTRLLRTLLLCLLLVTSTSCFYFNQRFRGPCGLWPASEPAGTTPVTQFFTSAAGRFRIDLPPQEKTEVDANNNTQSFNWFIVNIGEFQLLYSDYDVVLDTPETSQSIINNVRGKVSADGKLVVDSEIIVSGHAGREFRVETTGGTRIDRIYLAGNRFYVLSVFVPRKLSCKIGSAVEVLDTFEIIEDTAM